MPFHEPGIQPQSVHHFCSPSPLARQLHFYVSSLGHFFVEPPYHVRRLDYNSYLLMLIHAGRLRMETERGAAVASAGCVVLIDCHRPHRYWADGRCEFSFMHFDGAMSGAFAAALTAHGGPVLAVDAGETERFFSETLALFASTARPNEAALSLKIHALLCGLLQNGIGAQEATDDQPIRRATDYAHRHLAEPLTVEALANVSGFSLNYFSRRFRQETGMTPYHYILACRVDKAKQLLGATSDSVERVALAVGFSSAESFIHAFTRMTGTSPARFRRMPL